VANVASGLGGIAGFPVPLNVALCRGLFTERSPSKLSFHVDIKYMVHVDFTGESVGYKVGVGAYALTSTLRMYDEATRLYIHGEATFILVFGFGFGGGIGWDIPLGKAQSVIIQPQICVQTYPVTVR